MKDSDPCLFLPLVRRTARGTRFVSGSQRSRDRDLAWRITRQEINTRHKAQDPRRDLTQTFTCFQLTDSSVLNWSEQVNPPGGPGGQLLSVNGINSCLKHDLRHDPTQLSNTLLLVLD